MKTNRIIVRALLALGFGSAVGLSTGCSASRAQRSRGVDVAPAADSVIVRDGDVQIRVMYGSPPARFDPNRDVRRMETPTVSGRVTDEKGEPLPGAIVYVAPDGSRGWAIVNEEGRYSVPAVVGDSLRIEFLGYMRQTVEVKKRRLDIRMEVDTIAMNEVIRVAYAPHPARFDSGRPVQEETTQTQPE